MQTYEEPNPNDYKNVSFIEIGQLEAGQKSERHVEAILKKNGPYSYIVMAFEVRTKRNLDMRSSRHLLVVSQEGNIGMINVFCGKTFKIDRGSLKEVLNKNFDFRIMGKA